MQIAAHNRLEELAIIVKEEKVSHAKSGLRIGGALCEARTLLKEEKRFTKWVEEECQYSVRTAYNYMSAYRHFNNVPGHIDVTAMYLLASPSSPTEAIEEAKRVAASGETVTLETAKRILGKHYKDKQVENKVPFTGAIKKVRKPREEPDERDFKAEAARAAALPPVDASDADELPGDEAAALLLSKAIDTIYRLVNVIDEIHSLAPSGAIRDAVQTSLQVAVDDMKLWKDQLE